MTEFKNTNYFEKFKLVTWNVNGIRSRIFDNKTSVEAKNKQRNILDNSSLFNLLKEEPDFISLQETRCSTSMKDLLKINGYNSIFNESKLAGARGPGRYSGTAIYYKKEYEERISKIEFDIPEYLDEEGRIICLYLDNSKKLILNIYVPNSGTNFNNRLRFQKCLKNFLSNLFDKKVLIFYCGDYNVAYREEDVHFNYTNSSTYKNVKNTNIVGFLDEERDFIKDLTKNMIDTFIECNKNNIIDINENLPGDFNGFTWWDPRSKKVLNNNGINIGTFRYKNIGWRIDYIFVNKHENLLKIENSKVLKHIGEENDPQSSDHAPLISEILIKIN